MTSAEQLFSSVMQRSLMSFTQVFTFRQTAHVAISDASASLLRIERLYAEMTFSSSSRDKYFTGSDKALEFFGGLEGLATSSADRRAAQFTSMVEAASLIYAHSLLDGIAHDLCVCTARISPALWRNRIEQRKVTLKEVMTAQLSELEGKLIAAHLEALEKESLSKKIEALFSVCRPPEKFNPFTPGASEYTFDPGRLKALDDRRHDLVHGVLPLEVSISPNDVEFMQKTALYLSAMVSAVFSIKADPRHLVQIVST